MLLKLLGLATSSGHFKVTIAILAMVLCMAHFNPRQDSFKEKVDAYCADQINLVTEKLTALKISCEQKASLTLLREQFIASRLAYKKLAVLTEYYNVYETKFLNGPALNRAEDGTPDVIIPPQGFQAIEEILFSTNTEAEAHKNLTMRVENMLTVLKRLENETDRSNKFTEETVWDAVRSAMVRVVALGITGYDSPVALNSLLETKATLDGIKDVLLFFQPGINRASPGSTDTLIRLADNATRFLTRHNKFNEFDRLGFISGYMNPLYKQLYLVRLKTGIPVPPGQSAVNFNAESIFQDKFFNVNFFSPPKEYWVTDKRVELGKKLFSDPILSGTKNRSCASCHSPEKAFTDGLRVPVSLDQQISLSRNSPTLWNSGLQTRQFFDTRTDLLEGQLKEVVHNSAEMKGSLRQSVTELKKQSEYLEYFNEAYSDEKEPVNAFNIANAISSYIRSLTSFDSRFDQYMLGDKAKLTPSEKRGFNLFTGKAKCATCHFVPLFNGLVPPEFSETETEVLGVPQSKNKVNAILDADLGKYDISKSVVHKHSFKTPTLRNIELTGPYMHNGVFDTLEEVMDFYNEGGGEGLHIAPENQTLSKEKLNLTRKETQDIIAFMKSLTGHRAKHYKN